MLEVRELSDLSEKLDGVYGDEELMQQFIAEFEAKPLEQSVKDYVLAILNRFLGETYVVAKKRVKKKVINEKQTQTDEIS